MVYVLDNLAIGNYHDAQHRPEEIGTLLCVANDIHPPDSNCPHHLVPICDMCPIPAHQLKEALYFINEHIENSKVMVYCNEGIGRSPSVVIAFLCIFLKLNFGEAVEYVAIRKPYISILPNLLPVINEVKKEVENEQ